KSIINRNKLSQTGGAAAAADLQNISLTVFQDKVRVDGAVIKTHRLYRAAELDLGVFHYLLRQDIRRVMSNRNAGVTVINIIAVREDERDVAVIGERLRAELLALDKFFHQKIIFAGIFTDIIHGGSKLIGRIYADDTAASGGIHRFENERKVQITDRFPDIRVGKRDPAEAG